MAEIILRGGEECLSVSEGIPGDIPTTRGRVGAPLTRRREVCRLLVGWGIDDYPVGDGDANCPSDREFRMPSERVMQITRRK